MSHSKADLEEWIATLERRRPRATIPLRLSRTKTAALP